uniref:Uncharacterized protein n=1 Tax=Plectus sambesii TaxID=2011161 RepID=A0A914XT81_9BILA
MGVGRTVRARVPQSVNPPPPPKAPVEQTLFLSGAKCTTAPPANIKRDQRLAKGRKRRPLLESTTTSWRGEGDEAPVRHSRTAMKAGEKKEQKRSRRGQLKRLPAITAAHIVRRLTSCPDDVGRRPVAPIYRPPALGENRRFTDRTKLLGLTRLRPRPAISKRAGATGRAQSGATRLGVNGRVWSEERAQQGQMEYAWRNKPTSDADGAPPSTQQSVAAGKIGRRVSAVRDGRISKRVFSRARPRSAR